jgi:hypothetical protein
MSQPRPTDPIGSIGWTERTGGVLTARECLTLARPLLRGELSILAGRLAMVLRMHSGRRSSIDPASLVPPDSPLATDAESRGAGPVVHRHCSTIPVEPTRRCEPEVDVGHRARDPGVVEHCSQVQQLTVESDPVSSDRSTMPPQLGRAGERLRCQPLSRTFRRNAS